jgi:hypothetical protein
MNQKERLIQWLESSKEQDRAEISKYKNEIISNIKGLKKTDIIPVPKKITIWKRILKALNF